MNKFVSWIKEAHKEDRSLRDIPPGTMDLYVGGFLMSLKKEKGGDYEPDSLTGFHRAINRRLEELNYGYDLVKSAEFKTSKDVLAARRRELKQAGKGNKPNKADALTPQDEEKLWETGQLGLDTPESLFNTVWYLNAKLFGFRGSHEARQLKWGDIKLIETEDGDILEFNERETKTRTGNSSHLRPFKPKIYATEDPARCPIVAYKKFAEHRPQLMLSDEAPFYLAINYRPITIWFKAQAMGNERLQKTMARMASNAGLVGHFTNHSVRKTMCQQLLHAGVPPTTIIQLTGHKNVQSLNHYATASKNQQKEMGQILLGQKRSNDCNDTPTLPLPTKRPNIALPSTSNDIQLTPSNHQSVPTIEFADSDSLDGPVFPGNAVSANLPIAPSSSSSISSRLEARSQNMLSGMFAGATFNGPVNISF
jgi:integrase